MELKGRTALVTAGETGIGRAVCLGLARRGADIAFSHRGGAGEKIPLVDELQATGVKVLASRVDITDETAVRDWIREVVEKLGSIDIVVNNAGTDRDRTLIKMTRAMWDEVLGINLNGPFNVIHAALQHMINQNWGRIINIAPARDPASLAPLGSQSITKGGLAALTMTLAREVARRGITVNAVEPGYTVSEDANEATAEDRDLVARLIPMGRPGTPEEIAEAVIFLASPRASFITGQIIRVNGGLTM